MCLGGNCIEPNSFEGNLRAVLRDSRPRAKLSLSLPTAWTPLGGTSNVNPTAANNHGCRWVLCWAVGKPPRGRRWPSSWAPIAILLATSPRATQRGAGRRHWPGIWRAVLPRHQRRRDGSAVARSYGVGCAACVRNAGVSVNTTRRRRGCPTEAPGQQTGRLSCVNAPEACNGEQGICLVG